MALKKKYNDEIDLIELTIIFWNSKLKIIFITILFTIFMLIYSSNNSTDKIIYSIKTQIKPISIYEELEYDMYNTYVRKLTSSDNYFSDDSNLNFSKLIKTNISLINKEYLLNLYIEKLNEKTLLISAIEKYGLINKNNYENIINYKEDVKKLASTIKLTKLPTNKTQFFDWVIEFRTSNPNDWKKALLFININTNKEVKEFLHKKFDQKILQENKIIEYQIEDINTLITNYTNNIEDIDTLNTIKKNTIINKKKLTRLKDAFYNSPIVKSDIFSAAKLDISSSKISIENGRSNNLGSKVLASILFGLLLGILYTLIENSVRNRLFKKI